MELTMLVLVCAQCRREGIFEDDLGEMEQLARLAGWFIESGLPVLCWKCNAPRGTVAS